MVLVMEVAVEDDRDGVLEGSVHVPRLTHLVEVDAVLEERPHRPHCARLHTHTQRCQEVVDLEEPVLRGDPAQSVRSSTLSQQEGDEVWVPDGQVERRGTVLGGTIVDITSL